MKQAEMRATWGFVTGSTKIASINVRIFVFWSLPSSDQLCRFFSKAFLSGSSARPAFPLICFPPRSPTSAPSRMPLAPLLRRRDWIRYWIIRSELKNTKAYRRSWFPVGQKRYNSILRAQHQSQLILFDFVQRIMKFTQLSHHFSSASSG